MDAILISMAEPSELELLSFPVVCLYLFPRNPGLIAPDNIAIWQHIRDLVNARCGGEIAMVGASNEQLFYPNNYTHMLAALLTEPAFFDFLEERDFDGRVFKLFFHHSYRWLGMPFRPVTPAVEEEEQLLPKFTLALRQMGRYSEARHFIPATEPKQQRFCINMPPMKWFLTAPARETVHPSQISALKATGPQL